MKAHGIKTATYRQREQTVSQTMIVLREPTQATVSKLEELKSQIAGSTVNTGAARGKGMTRASRQRRRELILKMPAL